MILSCTSYVCIILQHANLVYLNLSPTNNQVAGANQW